ncbi:fluoride efflux transporter CrcB [Brevundimonas aurantiaca]|uniref:fluoride efflux transporter CrcB n=1 Tax=Brevundimonas aurantiaca TaxID=74316 RepID=UPI0015FF7759
MTFLIVFLGAGLGGAARHGVNLVALRWLGPDSFPVGTLFINVLGSLLMGVVAEYFLVRVGLSQHLRLFLTTGILGGFTTFSAFSLETALLWERGEPFQAVAYALLSVSLAVAGLFVGLVMARTLAGLTP